MSCKCGGKLKRIAVDCYECENCKLKHKAAFINSNVAGVEYAKGPDKPVEINITIGIIGAPRPNLAELIIKEMEKNRSRLDYRSLK